MPMIEEVRVRGGRRVAVHRLAEGEGDRTVVFCHAAPGSGAFDPEPTQTSARAVSLLAVDRPGYGRFDPVGADEWATVSGAAGDVADVLDQLGAGPVGVAMLTAAFAQGAAGMAADIAGYCLQPWGFEPADVKAKTLLVYGARDATAGPRHGSWWQERLPDARLEVVPGAGHLLVIPMWERVLSHLAPHTRR
jgi:pimeloyl-ACP methyl ester carboxylesterase